MRKFIVFIVILALALAGYYYRDTIKTKVETYLNKSSNENESENEKILRETPKIIREFPPKEVKIFALGKDKTEIYFSKTATAESKNIVYLTPQVTGKITGINIKVGDTVNEGNTLITLGESLSTDLTNLQLKTASNSLDLIYATEYLTNESNFRTLIAADLGVKTAYESYKNTLNSYTQTKSQFKTQTESAKLSVETAENAYDYAKDNYETAKDNLSDLEDKYDELAEILPASDTSLQELETGIKQAEAQVDAAKFAKENAKIGTKQADLGLTQTKKTQSSQLSQLDFGIEAASLQFLGALNSMQIAKIGGEMQNVAIQSQINQAISAIETIRLSLSYLNIKAPITGTITEITAVEGNLAAPGQILAKIETGDFLSIKTSINSDEATLISLGDLVLVENSNNSKVQGEVISISPIADSMTKKISVEIQIQSGEGITSGSLVKVDFWPATNKTFIPLNAVEILDGEKTVKIVNEKNKAEIKKVKTGQIIGKYIEISEGLNGNEKIIALNDTFINEGEKVAVVK